MAVCLNLLVPSLINPSRPVHFRKLHWNKYEPTRTQGLIKHLNKKKGYSNYMYYNMLCIYTMSLECNNSSKEEKEN